MQRYTRANEIRELLTAINSEGISISLKGSILYIDSIQTYSATNNKDLLSYLLGFHTSQLLTKTKNQ